LELDAAGLLIDSGSTLTPGRPVLGTNGFFGLAEQTVYLALNRSLGTLSLFCTEAGDAAIERNEVTRFATNTMKPSCRRHRRRRLPGAVRTCPLCGYQGSFRQRPHLVGNPQAGVGLTNRRGVGEPVGASGQDNRRVADAVQGYIIDVGRQSAFVA
jgi:hypothetical protein